MKGWYLIYIQRDEIIEVNTSCFENQPPQSQKKNVKFMIYQLYDGVNFILMKYII